MKSKKIITAWLYTGLILIALMVIIGGITRLTNSGLSIVEWRLIGGVIPPLNDLEWEETFKKYQQFPEYQKINNNMEINEFKFIFFWEYIHRLLGRLIGLVFIIPFIFFWKNGWLEEKEKKQLLILLFLGATQGFLGWFMVKSGLVDIPAVSHYRLALHLICAFGIMCYIYWLILSMNNVKREPNNIINLLSRFLLILLIAQIIYGAFTAGLKAGYLLSSNGNMLTHIFGYTIRNTDDFNLLSNSFDIQAFHRFLAWLIFIIVIITVQKSRKTTLKNTGLIILLLTLTQIILGILTLLSGIQIHAAITHQFIAIVLLLSVIHLTYLSNKKSL